MRKHKTLFIYNLIILVVALLATIIVSFVFLPKYQASQAEANKITSVYEKADIDFVLPSPSNAQIEELRNTENITSVFACYSVNTTLSFYSRKVPTSVLLLNEFEDLNKTLFIKERIITAKENYTASSILIDEVTASQYGLTLGTQIEWIISSTQSVQLIVDGIYYTNDFDPVHVIIFNKGEQKAIIDNITANSPLKPSCAYVSSSNVSHTAQILAEYKPLGMLKTYESFDTYSAYEKYLEDFYKEDYYSQITKAEDYKTQYHPIAEEYMKEATNTIYTQAIIIFTTVLACALLSSIFMIAPTIVAKIQKGDPQKNSIALCLLCDLAVTVLAVLGSVIIIPITLSSLPIFILWVNCLSTAIPFILAALLQVYIITNKTKLRK